MKNRESDEKPCVAKNTSKLSSGCKGRSLLNEAGTLFCAFEGYLPDKICSAASTFALVASASRRGTTSKLSSGCWLVGNALKASKTSTASGAANLRSKSE